MTLQDYLVIVVVEDDNNFPSIEQRFTTEFQADEVICVHAPIGSNTLVTSNGLHDALANSTRNFVIVAMESALDKTDIESAVAKFKQGYIASQKPLLRKGYGRADFEWYGRYDLASAIVVARCDDLFNVLKTQMTKQEEGESK